MFSSLNIFTGILTSGERLCISKKWCVSTESKEDKAFGLELRVRRRTGWDPLLSTRPKRGSDCTSCLKRPRVVGSFRHKIYLRIPFIHSTWIFRPHTSPDSDVLMWPVSGKCCHSGPYGVLNVVPDESFQGNRQVKIWVLKVQYWTLYLSGPQMVVYV